MVKWHKKAVAISTAVVMTTALMGTAAFAAGPTHDQAAAAKHVKGPVVHLTYWNMWSGVWVKVVQKMVDAFNRTHPDIQVKMLTVPSSSGEQKLLTAIAAGDPPDVFTEWNPYVAAFAQKGALINLSQYMVGPYAGLKHWFYPVAAKWGDYDGKMYAMPWTMNTFLLYYNKTIMRESGLNPNKPPKTLAQLWADQAKEWRYGKDGVVTQIGFYPSSNFDFQQLMPAFGATAADFFHDGKYVLTGKKPLEMMQFEARFAKYPYAQVNAFETGINGAVGGSEDPFELGKAGFFINGMWEIPTIKEFNPHLQYGAEPIPPGPGGFRNATWINGNYNEIPTGAKYPKQAFEFIAWLSGYHNAAWAAAAYPTGGWIPNSPEITKQPAYQKFLNSDALQKPFVSVMLNKHDAITPVTPVDEFFDTKLTNAIDYVLQKKKSPYAAMKHLQDESNQQLQESMS